MKKTYLKFLKRSVWRTKARFFAILSIVAIGVGFLGGLTSATPDMQLTIDQYYETHKVHDINIKGPMGITGADLAAISAIEGVESVTPAYVTDLVLESAGSSYTARIFGMPLAEDMVNGFSLVEGRLPQAPNECLLYVPGSYVTTENPHSSLRISAQNKNADTLEDTYAFTTLTTVGVVTTPLFFSRLQEPSTVGSGSVQLVLFVPTTAYALDVYTDAFVRLEEARSSSAFSTAYETLTQRYQTTLEDLGAQRSALRFTEITAEAQAALADGQKEYDDGKAEAESALADAAKTLEDGRKELLDSQTKITDGQAQLLSGKQALEDGKVAWEKGQADLEKGKNEAAIAAQTLRASRQELEAAQSTLNTTIAQQKSAFSAQIPTLVQEQYDKLSAQIDTGEAQGNATLAENEATLTAGKAALEQGKQSLASTEQQLADAQVQLDAGMAQYHAAAAQLASARDAFDAGKTAFAAAIAQQRLTLEANAPAMTPEDYAAAKEQLDQAEQQGLAQLDQQEAPLIAQEQALADAKAELDNKEAQLSAGFAQLAAGQAELDKQEATLTAGFAALEAGKQQLIAEIAKNRQALADSRPQIQAAVQQQGYAAIEAARAEAQAKLDIGLAQLTAGEIQLAASQAQITSGQAELDASYQTIQEGLATLAQKELELQDAKKALAQGTTDLAKGETTYQAEKAKAEQELADAQAKLTQAQADVAAIKATQWMLFDRNDIASFASYKGDSSKVAAIATIFPIFFFLVAALVALTTMTRLVEEERTQIGVFKALGYSNRLIVLYYLGYSVLASLLGSIIGIVLGSYTLPTVIASAYDMSYTAPPLITKFWWGSSLLLIAIGTLCTTAAAWAACMSQLREKPAGLMQPRAPQTGKRILLERFAPLWKRLSFTQKITARNIFRYKKRLVMTVFGIAGCAALLVTAFGLRDSIAEIGRKQFGEIYKYSASVTLKEDGAAHSDPQLKALLTDTSTVSSFAEAHTAKATLGTRSCTLISPKNTADFEQQLLLRNMQSGKTLTFTPTSFMVTQKMSEGLGLKVGDSIAVINADGIKADLTVTGIVENYVSDFIFLGAQLYQEAFGQTPSYATLFVSLTAETAALQDSFSQRVLLSDKVLLSMFNQTISENFTDSVKNIDSIVMVLIGSAGALAMIVLYNLTNINICERRKELATIKVLGFHQKELAGYIYRETTILCVLGILAGCVLGIFLHAFVIRTAEVDAVMFGRNIHFFSYVFSAAVTLFFTALVDVLMLKKLRKIDMVESMKAAE